MSDKLSNMELGLIIAVGILGFIVIAFILHRIYTNSNTLVKMINKVDVLKGYDNLKTEDQIDVYNRIKVYLEQQDDMLNSALDKKVEPGELEENLPEDSDEYGDTLRLSKR